MRILRDSLLEASLLSLALGRVFHLPAWRTASVCCAVYSPGLGSDHSVDFPLLDLSVSTLGAFSGCVFEAKRHGRPQHLIV